jgi:hypothetical protein
MSASTAFGAPWHPNDSDRYVHRSFDHRAPRTRARTSSRDIDVDWSDEPYDYRDHSEASGSDNDESKQKVKRRPSTSK